MLISYLATRKIVLPFNNIPELVSKSSFRIALTTGSSYEDAFKTSRDPDWMVAWTDRIQPYLEDYVGDTEYRLNLIMTDPTTALYANYFQIV